MRIALFLLGLVCGAVAVYFWLDGPRPDATDRSATADVSAEADDDDDEVPIRQRVVVEDGRRLIRLTPAERELAGIRSARFDTTVLVPEFPAVATVVDPAPLLELRDAVIAAQAARAAQQGTAQRLKERVERLRELAARGEIVATGELSTLEVELQREAERSAAHAARIAALKRDAVLSWGAELGALINDPEAPLLDALARREQVLLRLTLRPGDTLPADTAFVFVQRSADRRAAAKAYRIGEAPATSPTTQGETYFLRTGLSGLRAGMRLNVWVPDGRGPVEGVSLPPSAVVWHGGGQWFYVEVEANTFERVRLPEALDDDRGLFIPGGLGRDRPVVVQGTQALLAEEFRDAIPEEDDD